MARLKRKEALLLMASLLTFLLLSVVILEFMWLGGSEAPSVIVPAKKWKGSQIRPYLYLGSKYDASNLHALQRAGITHILNVADDAPNYFPDKFIYCNLDVKDFGKDDGISRVFPQAAVFIQRVIDEQGIVLVHCVNGINRSVTTVLAFLMQLEGVSLKEAWQQVKSSRTQAGPFRDNREELIRFEISLFGESTMTLRDFKSM